MSLFLLFLRTESKIPTNKFVVGFVFFFFSFFLDLSLANLVSRSFISVSKVIILWASSFLPGMMLD